jgi:hypothetical protein
MGVGDADCPRQTRFSRGHGEECAPARWDGRVGQPRGWISVAAHHGGACFSKQPPGSEITEGRSRPRPQSQLAAVPAPRKPNELTTTAISLMCASRVLTNVTRDSCEAAPWGPSPDQNPHISGSKFLRGEQAVSEIPSRLRHVDVFLVSRSFTLATMSLSAR